MTAEVSSGTVCSCVGVTTTKSVKVEGSPASPVTVLVRLEVVGGRVVTVGREVVVVSGSSLVVEVSSSLEVLVELELEDSSVLATVVGVGDELGVEDGSGVLVTEAVVSAVEESGVGEDSDDELLTETDTSALELVDDSSTSLDDVEEEEDGLVEEGEEEEEMDEGGSDVVEESVSLAVALPFVGVGELVSSGSAVLELLLLEEGGVSVTVSETTELDSDSSTAELEVVGSTVDVSTVDSGVGEGEEVGIKEREDEVEGVGVEEEESEVVSGGTDVVEDSSSTTELVELLVLAGVVTMLVLFSPLLACRFTRSASRA